MPAKASVQIEKKAWDGDGLPLEETNVAGIGTDEDKALRKQAAGTETAWENIGQAPGLWIFRIESFQVVPWPKEKYGSFHTGDSYIVLQEEKAVSEETGKVTDKLDRDIHFWLGSKTSIDEKGTAAYKTVELDDFFDGEATQYREVQGKESQQFQALFPHGLKYLSGGVESGFNVVQGDLYITRLYQVRRNNKKACVMEEEAVALATLNHRDAFILDMGKTIYVWSGDEAGAFVKMAANQGAENMEAERNGNATVVREVDDAFWEALGGKGEITAANAVGEEVEPNFGEGVLYSVQIGEEDRKLTVKEAGRGNLVKSMLDPTAVMMLDTRTEIFLWLGSEASGLEKRSAMSTAMNYLKMNGRSVDSTAITVLKQGHESKNKIWKATFADSGSREAGSCAECCTIM